jgi:hypothetical protein
MTKRGTAAALAFLLIGGHIGAESTAAFPLSAPPPRLDLLPPIVQHAGWDCDLHRCRPRPKQSIIRIIGRPSAEHFLAQVTRYLNCCNTWSVPYYGYAYGPEISFQFDFPLAPPAGFEGRFGASSWARAVDRAAHRQLRWPPR